MTDIATSLNETINDSCPVLFRMLSRLGRELFMPKGIITQSAEADRKAHKFNATLGIATSRGQAMHIESIKSMMPAFEPDEVFPYAPVAGLPALRKEWKKRILSINGITDPDMISTPVVTNGITHGLSIVSDIFVNEGDIILCPEMFWGNYKLIFITRRSAELSLYPVFKGRSFDVDGFRNAIEAASSKRKKLILMLNFPNNPAGYMINESEMTSISEIVTEVGNSGTDVLVVCDDAYFGLNYEDGLPETSVFAHFINRSENVAAIKLDAATKELFVWGFRVGFLTMASFSPGGSQVRAYEALNEKIAALIRGTVSNCARPSQEMILRAIKSENHIEEVRECKEELGRRYAAVKRLFSSGNYESSFEPYPFNSGYFMCVKLKGVSAEELRKHLLEKYGIGVVSTSETDIRIAFSSVDEEYIEEFFDTVHQACGELQS